MVWRITNRAALNFLYLGGGAKLLAEVEYVAALQSLTLGGSGGMLPQEILGVLEVHSGAF